MDKFLEELRKLSKNCNFEAATADVYRLEMICDSFVNGLSSNYIREHLLEKAALTLDQAYQQAWTLHIAQKNSEAYVQQSYQTASSSIATATIKPEPISPDVDPEILSAMQNSTL